MILTTQKYERKTILCSENLWASPDWARPDVQHDGDHLFHQRHQAYHHHHHCHHYHHHHHRDHEQVKPGERVVFNCKVDLSCMVSTIRWWAWWLLWFLGMIILVGGLIAKGFYYKGSFYHSLMLQLLITEVFDFLHIKVTYFESWFHEQTERFWLLLKINEDWYI